MAKQTFTAVCLLTKCKIYKKNFFCLSRFKLDRLIKQTATATVVDVQADPECIQRLPVTCRGLVTLSQIVTNFQDFLKLNVIVRNIIDAR